MQDAKPGAPERAADVYRKSIVETAKVVFLERGFAGTRMADIASAAGLAIGTVYNYFPSKESLVDALMEASADDFYVVLEDAVRSASEPLGRLRALISGTVRYLLENRARYRIFLELGKAPAVSAALNARQASMYLRYRRYMTELIEQARNEGVVRTDVAPPELAFVLMSAQDGLVEALLRDQQDGTTAGQSLDLLLDILLRGVAV